MPLTNGKGSFSRALGEFVVAGLLYFAKDFPRMRRNQAARDWAVFDVEELHGRTLGIVGYGDIGRAIAERAKPFGMRILGLRRQRGARPAGRPGRRGLAALAPPRAHGQLRRRGAGPAPDPGHPPPRSARPRSGP